MTNIHQIYRDTVKKLALEISSRQVIFKMVKCSTHPLLWPIWLLYWSIDFCYILYFTDRQDRSPFPIQTVSAKMVKGGLALGRSSVSWTFKLSRDSQEYLKNYWACTAQYALCAVWFPYSRTSRDISYTLSYPLKIFVPTCSVGSKTWLLRKRDFQILNLRFLGFFRVPKIMFLVTENKQRDKFSSSKDPSKEHRKNNLKKCSPRVFRITPTDFVNDIWCLMHATAQANPRTTISSK